MTNYAKLPTWADGDHVYAVVETPRGRVCCFIFAATQHFGAFGAKRTLTYSRSG